MKQGAGSKSLFVKGFLITTCLFYSRIWCFVSCRDITEDLGVTAVGDQELLPTASCVSSAKAPVTVSFSYTRSVFPREDLLAVICDNNVFLCWYFVSSQRFDLPIPCQMGISPPPKAHMGNLALQTLIFWPPGLVMRGQWNA